LTIRNIPFLIAKRTLLPGGKPASLELFGLTISGPCDGLDGQDKSQEITLQKTARIRVRLADPSYPYDQAVR
jgi:hypothetical protein